MTSPDPTTYPGLRLKSRLPTGDGHELFFAEFGQAKGLAVLHLHGGPGSGANPGDANLFDLNRMRLVLFDQRGTGDSTPAGGVSHNDTAHLLGVERIAHLPCRIIHGEQDLVCRPSASRELIAPCPDWRLVTVAGAGHALDHPGLRQAVRDGVVAIAAATGIADFQSASTDG